MRQLFRARARTTGLAIGPALLLLFVAAGDVRAPLHESACWLLPNARVLMLPGHSACPLRRDELVTAVLRGDERFAFGRAERETWRDTAVVEVMSGGERQLRRLPLRHVAPAERRERLLIALLWACLSLALPLAIVWTSRAAAATPIALLAGVVAAVGVGAICGRDSPLATSATLLAASAAPPVLLHVALVFPRERALVRAAPALLPLCYLPLLLFAPLGLFALHADPAVWPAFLSFLLALTGAAWLGVVTACVLALRESRSQLERARARALCLGATLLPIAPTAALAHASSDAATWAAAYVACATVTLPLPIGLAITSYNLFDVGWDTRRWIGRCVYLGGAALLLAAALRFGLQASAGPVAHAFALALCALAALEALRGRVLAAVDAVVLPDLQRLRREREAFAQRVVALRDEDEVARLLGDCVGGALHAASGCVALRLGRRWRVASSFGPAPAAAIAAAPSAAHLVAREGLAHLARPELEAQPAVVRLLAEGIELVAAVRAGQQNSALLVVGARERREPYSGFELEFVRSACQHAAAAFDNSRMARELVAAERRATSGRIAVALAHDLGKELAWIARLASRLPERAADMQRLARDADQIAELADAAIHELREFVTDASVSGGDARLARVDEIVELAVRQVSRLHAGASIAVRLDPKLRGARAHAVLTRVLANALENAILAADAAPTIEVSARAKRGRLRFAVHDAGLGMDAATLARACDAGFTSRAESGGLGMGLAAAEGIVAALGGRLGITSTPGRGTSVSVEVPAAAAPA